MPVSTPPSSAQRSGIFSLYLYAVDVVLGMNPQTSGLYIVDTTVDAILHT